MNHEYQASMQVDKCADCGYAENMHGPNAICESCNNTGELNPFGLNNKQALLCRDCIAREKDIILTQTIAIAESHQTPEKQQERLAEYIKITNPYDQMIRDARKIDEEVHLDTDIFNAKTVSFGDLRDAINSNPEIPQDKKYFELARVTKERIKHFQEVIFNLDKKKIEAYSEQKALHVALNDLANKLRVEEREQLKLSDIHYDVKMPKVVTPRTIKLSTKQPSKVELRKLAEELKMPEFSIKLMMTSKNWTIEQVGNHLRRAINEGKSMLPAPKSDGLPIEEFKPTEEE